MNLHRNPLILTLAFLAVALNSCRSSPDTEVLRAEILESHKKFIDDHLNQNIDSFVQDYAEDYIFVAHGEIDYRTRDEFKSSFRNYLNSTTFTEYRNLEEPIIGFSKDGSMAWSIVKVKVAGSRNMEDNSQKDFDVTYAWITLYERKGDKWVRAVEVSTNN